MKPKSRQCPNGHGAMHRCSIRIVVESKQTWRAVPWQYCPDCGLMMRD